MNSGKHPVSSFINPQPVSLNLTFSHLIFVGEEIRLCHFICEHFRVSPKDKDPFLKHKHNTIIIHNNLTINSLIEIGL